MTVGRFFRTPKGVLILLLVPLTVLASTTAGGIGVLPFLAAGAGAAMVVDLAVLRARKGRWIFPSGALLTGWIVVLVLNPSEPLYVAAVAAAVAVVSKYLLRSGTANVFNPAALGLVATFHLFDPRQNWWGALPEIHPAALVLLLAAGLFVTDRVQRLPAMTSFLFVYFLLFSTTAFLGDPGAVAPIFRPPDLNAALFFAFFMVTDPPTSPAGTADQLTFGALTAGVAYLIFELGGPVYFLLAGLLVANAWQAWRRVRDRTRRAAERAGRRPAASAGTAVPAPARQG